MPAAVTIVAGAASLAVAYAQLLSRPDDLALACAAFTAMYLMVHHAALAMDDGGVEAERAHGKRVALAMALVLYGLACAEVWKFASTREIAVASLVGREIAVAALASWCGAAVMLLVYLVVATASCAGRCYSAVATDVP